MTRDVKPIIALVLAASVSLAGPARGQLCERSAALRVTQPGFRFLAEQLRPLMPSQLTIPAISTVVYDWPLTNDDARLEMPPLPGALSIRELDVDLSGDALHLRGRFDLAFSSGATVHNPYGSFGTAFCTVSAELRDVQVNASFRTTMGGGGIHVENQGVHVTLDAPRSGIKVSGCDTLTVLAQMLGVLEQNAVEAVRAGFEGYARGELARHLESWLSDALTLSGEYRELSYTGQLVGVATEGSGLSSQISASVEGITAGASARCGVPLASVPPPPCGSPVALPPQTGSMFSMAVSEGLINRALYAVWSSGQLCVDSESLQMPAVHQQLDLLAPTLGLPPGTRVTFSVRTSMPPQVKLSTLQGAQLHLPHISLVVRAFPPTGRVAELAADADLTIAATPWVDPTIGGLALDLRRVSVNGLDLKSGGRSESPLAVDPARAQRFITDVVVPVLREQLASFPLSPSVRGKAGYLVDMKHVYIGDQSLALHVDAYKPSTAADQLPPETTLLEGPGSVVGPQVVTVRVSGIDDQTPTGLLSFRTRVDGGPWREPTYGGRIDFVPFNPTHTLEIIAIDMQGNADPSPLLLQLDVDQIAPTLEVQSAPDPLVNERVTTMKVSGRDDRTPQERLRWTSELWRVPDGGGMPQLVDSDDLPAGFETVRFADLGEGVYRGRVIVKDEAGNVTSEDVGFVVDHGGCATGFGANATPLSALALLLLGLLFCRFRARSG